MRKLLAGVIIGAVLAAGSVAIASPRSTHHAWVSNRAADDQCGDLVALKPKVRGYITYARLLHWNIVDLANRGQLTEEQIKISGGVAWNQMWVDHYDETLALLDHSRVTCP